MKKKYWLYSILGCVLLVFLLFGGKHLFNSGKAAALSDEDAVKIVEGKYPGKILNIENDHNQYVIDMERETGIYQIRLDEKSGAILSVTRIKEYAVEELEKGQKQGEEQTGSGNEPVEKATPSILSEEDAIKIALQHVQGTIDDVELENVNGVVHYFIEVETNDEQEATVEINSITGEVKSLTWDD